jgi:hypothetical protein
MIRRILSGDKTQTRRIIKPQPREGIDAYIGGIFADGKVGYVRRPDGRSIVCPYGRVGDRLWCKETFSPYCGDTPEESEARFLASKNIKSLNDLYKWAEMPNSGGEKKAIYAADFGEYAKDMSGDIGGWTPSIFMPRWASRINLEITEMRVQRVQEISKEDVMAEGVSGGYEPGVVELPCEIDATNARLNKCALFASLWDSINKLKANSSWESNPWVWCISFRRLDQ